MRATAAAVWLLGPIVAGMSPTQGPAPPEGPLVRFEYEETHMASPFKIVLYSTEEATARRASHAAFDRIAALNTILSDYDPESELSRLAQSAGKNPVPVSADLFEVLARSRAIYEESGGAFDITIAPVGRLWRRARRDHKLPDPSKLAEARKLVGSDRMVLNPAARTVWLKTAGMKLDAGGIAKGFAAQAALDVLKKAGLNRALVGGAGDIVVGDAPPGKKGWTIAIAPLEPGRPGGSPPALLLANAAVSTAGDAERFVIIDGHRYSHIINPVTGQAVEDRASVTVVAPDGGAADALETTVYILGPERGLKLVEQTPGAAAIYVRKTPEGIKTFESSRYKEIQKVTE
jgi:FAD:protein FMN transferase